MIISFAWTKEALLAGKKTVTRRDWSDKYAAQFKPGSTHFAFDKDPRYKGVRIGTIEIVSVRRESLDRFYSDAIYAAEELTKEGFELRDLRDFLGLFEGRKMRFGYPVRIEFKFTPDKTKP